MILSVAQIGPQVDHRFASPGQTVGKDRAVHVLSDKATKGLIQSDMLDIFSRFYVNGIRRCV